MDRRATRGELLLALVLVAAVVAVVAVLGVGHGRRGQRILADPVRTPGVLNPAVTQATIRSTICRRGWTATIRPPVSYTNALKVRQMKEYGEKGPLSEYQEDHLVSLELGGHPTDPRNLWPEPYPRAREVDSIENDLNAEVCDGSLALSQAQQRESDLKHHDG
jgi:hypothetical protein